MDAREQSLREVVAVGEDAVSAKQSARRQFDRWAQSYDRSLLRGFVFNPSMRACQEEILRWQALRGPRPYRLLDVGCGTGSLLALLTTDPLAERLIGVDYSSEMVGKVGRKIAEQGLSGRVHIVAGDAERLPFADESFDVVTCCNSFHHYPHQADAIRGFRRVLRPGGLVVLIDGFRDNVIGWLLFDVFVARVEGQVHHAAWSAVREMMRSAGFATVRQRKLNVLAPLLVSVATV